MEIILKNIREFSQLSRESTAFIADLFINGQKAGKIGSDGGRDGVQIMDANPDKYPNAEKLILQANAYVKKLPPNTTVLKGKSLKYNNLEFYLFCISVQFFEKKDLNKRIDQINKDTHNTIIVGKIDGAIHRWKLKKPIAQVLKLKGGKEFIQEQLLLADSIKVGGDMLFNNNIPADLIPKGLQQIALKKHTIEKEHKLIVPPIKGKRI